MFIPMNYAISKKQPLQLQATQKTKYGAPKYDKTKPFCPMRLNNIMIHEIFIGRSHSELVQRMKIPTSAWRFIKNYTIFEHITIQDVQTESINMKHTSINLNEKLTKFTDHWSPKIIAQMNNYHFKLVKFKGDFVWHQHNDTDETFLVLDGAMSIDFRDGRVDLKAGEMFVVPRAAEHKPFAKEECQALVIEPAGVINTGDAGGEMTAENGVWI
jgi:mannose-6-phosphate isomerase-like protein (cupin superfamily)